MKKGYWMDVYMTYSKNSPANEYFYQSGQRAGKSLRTELIKLMPQNTYFRPSENVDKNKGTYSWTFPLAHPDMVSIEEVSNNINRHWPLGFLKWNGRVICLIHSSLMRKSRILNMQFPLCHHTLYKIAEPRMRSMSVYGITHCDIQKVIDWARKVKQAPWEDKAERVEAGVFLPEI